MAKGFLLAHGGGTTVPASTRAFIEFAGGPNAPIIVLPQSSAEAQAKGTTSADWLKQNGAKNVFASALTRADDPAFPDLLKRLADAGGVWMPGGDQNRLMALFARTPVPATVRAVLERGGIVGGTSAGASLLGEWMPTGNGDPAKMTKNGTETAPGLAVWPGVLVDTHFFVRTRYQRTVNMILSRPELVGVALDEAAWATFDNSKNQLTAGGGQVAVFRATLPVKTDATGRLSGELKQRVLLPGESLDLAAFRASR